MIDQKQPATRAARLERALRAALDPVVLAVEDESARHAGHAGARTEGETHYRVVAVSGRFAGMGLVARSRLVHDVLAEEFSSGLHALSLTLRSPDEEQSRKTHVSP